MCYTIDMPLDILLEGLLFYRAAPLKKQALIKQFAIDNTGLQVAISALKARLETGALRIIETDTEIQLVTAPALAPFIEDIRKQDVKSDIGKAGAETIAIILYRGTVSRSEIDQIRGVNSSFILRNLLVRGLIERVPAEKNGRYVFRITPDLLAHLGVSSTQELTDFARITDALEVFLTEKASDAT